MAENYSFTKYNGDTMARAKINSAPVSTKHSIEICNFLNGKNTKRALSYLEEVLAMEKAIPFKRFNGDVGHRTSVKGPGRYPVKAVAVVKNAIQSAIKNALFKGLNADNLFIIHIKADEGARPFHYGRQRRRQMKRTHVEVVILEKEVEKKVVKKKTETKATPKAKLKEEKETAKFTKEKAELKEEKKTAKAPKAKAEDKKEAPKTESKEEAQAKPKTEAKVEEPKE